MTKYAIGFDLGGTNVKAVAVTCDGKILLQDRFGTLDDEATRWVFGIGTRIVSMQKELGDASAIGIASPGLAASDGRTIQWMKGRLDGVMGFDWSNQLPGHKFVPVLNDAHAALLGEIWQGAAKGSQNVVMLTLGTGVGGAIVCDGRLLKGNLGRAGHFGHISLDPAGAKDIVNTPGSLEDSIGECTLQRRTEGKFASTRALVDAVNAGDSYAKQIWLTSVKSLAAAMAGIINAVDPEIFIIGGGIAQAGEALFSPLKVFLDEFEWRPTGSAVRVLAAVLGDHAGALGAAKNALDLNTHE